MGDSGHKLKWEAPTGYRRNFFTMKIVKQWSGLAREVMQSSCLEVFKTQLYKAVNSLVWNHNWAVVWSWDILKSLPVWSMRFFLNCFKGCFIWTCLNKHLILVTSRRIFLIIFRFVLDCVAQQFLVLHSYKWRVDRTWIIFGEKKEVLKLFDISERWKKMPTYFFHLQSSLRLQTVFWIFWNSIVT